MDIEPALSLMRSYYQERRHIEHTERVLAQAKGILGTVTPEISPHRFVSKVVQLAAIFHDIGIPNALKNHGSAAGPYQEQEGAALTPELLSSLDIRADIAARVTFLVGNHHTRDAVDGVDFQVLWDADMLVNLHEGNIVPDVPADEFIAAQFETAEGARRARTLLADQPE